MLSSEQAKAARSGLGFSQSHVAQHTGINRTYLSLFEAGKYVLDDEALSALQSFYEGEGHDFEEPEADEVGAEAVDVVQDDISENAGGATNDSLPPPLVVSADPRMKTALTTLNALQSTATSTGTDSKRTAAAVASARGALVGLDYPELCALAVARKTALDGFPSLKIFRYLQIAEKETWEDRAVSVLICAALYQARWQMEGCVEWQRVGRTLVQQEFMEEDTRPKRTLLGLLGNSEDNRRYLQRARACMAPALLRAAEQRRPISLPPR